MRAGLSRRLARDAKQRNANNFQAKKLSGAVATVSKYRNDNLLAL
jgi:hypothetical protein